MSFLKNLFGLGKGNSTAAAKEPLVHGQEVFEGYVIKAALLTVGSEFQVRGFIEKEINGDVKTYEFIRADKFSSKEDATAVTLNKAKQIIREQGLALYA